MSGKTSFRKSVWAYVGLMPSMSIGILVGCTQLASGQSTAEQTLIDYDKVYAHGPVGWGDRLTSAEIALREIHKRKDAGTVLAGLYPKCHPVGKAYVLSALWLLDTNRFCVLGEDFLQKTGAISVMNGDIGWTISREELIRAMQYQTSGYAFNPIKLSDAARKRDQARKLHDTEELLSKDPNWRGINSAFTVKEIWDQEDLAVITLATNVPSKREIRVRVSAPWHDGKITLQHSLPGLLAVVTDLMESHALDNVPRSKRVTVWGERGRLFDERDIWDGLKKAMALQAAKSEWIEVVITDWNPEGWDDNYLKLFHQLGSQVWLNEDGTAWDHISFQELLPPKT
jgi:hypothetical protein